MSLCQRLYLAAGWLTGWLALFSLLDSHLLARQTIARCSIEFNFLLFALSLRLTFNFLPFNAPSNGYLDCKVCQLRPTSSTNGNASNLLLLSGCC